MNLLLDTHVLLWWLDDNPTLSDEARAAIRDGRNLVFISAAAIWEIRIKQALGKLEIPTNFGQVLDEQSFHELPITIAHANAVAELPGYHRDPFDRMLIAQTKVEGFSLVTRDMELKKYNVQLICA